MGAVEGKLSGPFACRDPGEGAQIREADLHRLSLHIKEGGAVQFGVTSANPVARSIKHSHPVGDELPMPWPSVIELAGKGGRATAAHPVAQDQNFIDVELGDGKLEG